MLLLLVPLAFAGYGDASDGLPSLDERQLMVWSNAARVDPEAFSADYSNAGCSFASDFTDTERTPQNPLRWNADLNESARFHSDDMFKNNWFDHKSSDGTPFGARIGRFYEGPAGENIAQGYMSPYSVVFEGWMCSAGHRQNLMRPDYDELGTGIAGTYYTQNFGQGGIAPHQVGTGAHWMQGDNVIFRADVFDPSGAVPDAVNVVWNGVPGAMTVDVGTDARGVYRASRNLMQAEETDQVGCMEYYFQADYGEKSVRFPESGSYGWGDCFFADEDAQWIDRQLEPEPEDKGGCNSVSSLPSPLWAGAFGLLILARRRSGRES
ncbi:MAG: CAP domain-containing protein [Myxococcota bacterium]